MSLNIPNTLTLMRIMLIPVLVVVFYVPFKNHLLVAAGIFAIAAITDWFDGYLARRLGQMTAFGAFLDPVADQPPFSPSPIPSTAPSSAPRKKQIPSNPTQKANS